MSTSRVNPADHDLEKGAEDARRGVKKCLKPENKDDPKRFAARRVGFASIDRG